jgi:hypothetical protein
MSTIDSDDLEATGYFLPEDSQLRLKQLREYMAFLANLARPRRPDEDREWTVEIRVGEVAICLELLEEQIGQVLEELSWPAERGLRAAVQQKDDTAPVAMEAEATKPEAAEEGTDGPGVPYLFGVTLNQVDEINLLLEMIGAHSDVVIASHEAEFADHTLSLVGHAIFCDTQKLRDIIRDVNEQRLQPVRGTRTGVREERVAYHALPACLSMPGASRVVRQLPTYQ